MRFIGGKSLLLDKINNVVKENCADIDSVMDIFAGSGTVSSFFKSHGWQVFSNDILYFSYVLQKVSVEINEPLEFNKLSFLKLKPLDYLNLLSFDKSGFNIEDCFVYQNYSLGGSSRMYFQEKNALKIDIIRLTIEKWKSENLINDNEYYYLLASLLNAVPYVANITGVYAAYLKFWDVRTYNDLELKEVPLIFNHHKNKSYNCDYQSLLTKESTLLYADPPYNQREYAPNYHLLETIARYDYPEVKGVTGMRNYKELKSVFCSKKTVENAFETLIRESSSKYILISYNNEGLISTKVLTDICQTYAIHNTFKLYEFDYRRYKNKIPNNSSGLKEQLYFLRRN